MAFETAQETNEIISINPATNKEVGRVKIFSEQEVFDAVTKSRKVSEIWQKTTFAKRRKIIMSAREVILSEMDEIARLISDEMGKTNC